MKHLKINVIGILLAAAVSFLAITTFAADPKTTPEPNYKYVELLNADSSRFKLGNEKIYILKGNVKMKQGDTVLNSDSVEYNQNEKVQTAVATGNLKITDPQNEITGEKGTTYFREKRAVVDGNVKILAKPRAGEAKDTNSMKGNWKEKATITCDKLEYFYKTKVATLTGNLKVVQKGRVVFADSAVYDVKEEQVVLSGNVKGHDDKNQTFASQSDVKVSLKEGNEWIEMKHATGTFRVEIDEEEEPAETPKAPETKDSEAVKP